MSTYLYEKILVSGIGDELFVIEPDEDKVNKFFYAMEMLYLPTIISTVASHKEPVKTPMIEKFIHPKGGLQLYSTPPKSFAHEFILTDVKGERLYGFTFTQYPAFSEQKYQSLISLFDNDKSEEKKIVFTVGTLPPTLYAARSLTLITKHPFRSTFVNLMIRFIQSLKSSVIFTKEIAERLAKILNRVPFPQQTRETQTKKKEINNKLSFLTEDTTNINKNTKKQETNENLKNRKIRQMKKKSLKRRPKIQISKNNYIKLPKINSKNRIPNTDIVFDTLFFSLSPTKILKFFFALLNECRVVVTSKCYSKIVDATESILVLLYPFNYPYTYIPILPYEFWNVIESPIPYFIGCHSSILEYEEVPDEVVVIDLDRNMVTSSLHIETPPKRILKRLLKSIKKYANIHNSNHIITKRKSLINKRPRAKSLSKLSSFRRGSYSSLSETDDQNISNSKKGNLTNNKNNKKKKNNNDQLFLLNKKIDIMKIRKAFVNFFLSLLWKYPTYVKYEEIEQTSEEDQFLLNTNDLFDSDNFLKNISEDILPYLKIFIKSQMFIYFLQESLNPKYKETFFSKELKKKSLRHYKRYLQFKMKKEKVTGFIQKQGKIRHGWKNRYFELENRELKYYHVINFFKKKQTKRFKGKIMIIPGKTKFLIPYKIDDFPTKYAFILKNENTEWKFCCENYPEFKKWIISIRAESFNDEEIQKIFKKLLRQGNVTKKCQDIHQKKTSSNLLHKCMSEKNISTRFIGSLVSEENFEIINHSDLQENLNNKTFNEKEKLHRHLFDSLDSQQFDSESDSDSSSSSSSSSSSDSSSSYLSPFYESDPVFEIDPNLKNDIEKIEKDIKKIENTNEDENECNSEEDPESESESKSNSTNSILTNINIKNSSTIGSKK
ncbi:c-myc promoter binding protein [Anaeramoeba flamelloides]|uniref:C-myc promoter binding protein n=1 Tax=Anaeramoeba flamelloides TaxID=1746091 RepID=A0ABQ8YTI5_9EUKA|nr:c-myc promoter binding protein [Anaeramoeba flamelloides]